MTDTEKKLILIAPRMKAVSVTCLTGRLKLILMTIVMIQSMTAATDHTNNPRVSTKRLTSYDDARDDKIMLLVTIETVKKHIIAAVIPQLC